MAKQSKLDIGLRSKEQPEEKVNENSEDKNHSELFGTPLDERNIYSVKGISHRIKRILEQSEDLQGIWIRGEISNYTKHSSGHLYFTLKDEEATLSCVKFRGTGKKVRFDLDQGIKVIAFGDIGVYPPQGKYQFIVDEIRPDGLGALHMAFLQLKDKLSKEGLFDEIH
ncbi:MAG: exodeoxyribonuclease VII large subunit, partial [Thermoplasmata archaeon]